MSSKTVSEKMYIKSGMRIGFFNAPDNTTELLGGLPDDVQIIETLGEQSLDFVLGFLENHAMMEAYLTTLKDFIKDNGALWVAYHKGSSSVDTDINRDSIYKYGQSLNLKGVGIVSIDSNWSGFRFKKV